VVQRIKSSALFEVYRYSARKGICDADMPFQKLYEEQIYVSSHSVIYIPEQKSSLILTIGIKHEMHMPLSVPSMRLAQLCRNQSRTRTIDRNFFFFV